MPGKCFILSGVPGSGKSTWARTNCPDAVVCSADHYFTDRDGTYNFNADRLKNAHYLCLEVFVLAVVERKPCIVVDNTNRTVAEIAPYYRLAEFYGYEVEIVRFCVDPVTAGHRNVHGVPLDKVIQMANFEALPAWWSIRYVFGG